MSPHNLVVFIVVLAFALAVFGIFGLLYFLLGAIFKRVGPEKTWRSTGAEVEDAEDGGGARDAVQKSPSQ